MFALKVGMINEYHIACKYALPGTTVLSGVLRVADLHKKVPLTCKGIISFGMCGGLRPKLPVVGQTVIASALIGPDGKRYMADLHWKQRLFKETKFYVQDYYSSGMFNTASTPDQRAKLWRDTGAWCIDDESWDVVQFALERGIPWAIMRNCSDAWSDDVSITSNILSAGGGADPMAVLKDVVEDPEDMVKIGIHYETSNHWLYHAAAMVAPNFGWENNHA